MAIRAFDVGSLRDLRRAAAQDLPDLVAISGPNGSGKSSLLELLNTQKPAEVGTEILYVGPHRTWRSNPVNDLVLYGMPYSYGDILKQDAMPSIQYGSGSFNNFSGFRRIGSSADDAQAFVKASIVKIRNKKQRLVTQRYDDQGGQIAAGTVPDLLQPFQDLVQTLLPHLEWVGINDTNLNDIRCEFRSAGQVNGPVFDIDELSSGEKAAIALFLPFVERQIAQLAGEASATPDGLVPLTVLLDEPEQHLHALLQLNVLEYMRGLAAAKSAQFIFTVHSPSMLDALDTNELFLLAPSTLAADNQLTRLVDTSERLEAVRTLTGSTHMLTRCKPIVFVEGEPDDGKKATDERIFKILLPEVRHWAIVASKGKSQVVKAATEMRQAEVNLPGMPVFGLVDNDQGGAALPDFIVPWPVAMMENLLLDETALFATIENFPVLGLKSPEAVRKSLLDLAADQVEEEKRLRIREKLPRRTLAAESTDASANEETIDNAVEEYKTSLAKVNLAKLKTEIEAEVTSIVTAGEQLERFHGKKLLRAWFDKYASVVGMGWHPFLIQLASHAASGERLSRLAGAAISKIKLYFPDALVSLLKEAEASDARDTLLEACRAERDLWEKGKPDGASRESLRSQIIQYTREHPIEESLKVSLVQAATSMGTP